MAQVIATLRIMPESNNTDLNKVENEATKKCEAFNAEVAKIEHEKIAFGLIALKLHIIFDENKGTTEELEKDISAIAGVQSVDVVDIRRAIG